ncbi:aromatic ring-hydroxylating dioxygenase subunit alpha [Vineibacter terrae]|uniref:aromatic ring-hydroxylating oxygenase subunit alpha n=1 Tax=Vineibacter terrae TaxID=2586908 RepID=UPI002E37A95F|nr:aromatic ring-hydroxylating dioxygenase subunit alpha [Vineibacter terrae]HEX2890298.1 aromatic ring-hydroxylating dioxygenase subunit alpha [Vineibacter terrae]
MFDQPASDWLRDSVRDEKSRGVFRVHRRVFTEPGVLALERERIFDRCWLYLGHVSEVAEPGSFVARKVGGRPLIFNRDRSGAMHAFFNSCPHRGAMVCRERQGRSNGFVCPYHGWSFASDGRLTGQPLPESYASDLRGDPSLNLHEVPKLAEFRGFVFVNFDGGADSLENYLAGACEYLEIVSQHGEAGMEILPGSQSYGARANWKLLQENSADGYHANTTHATYFAYVKARDGAVLNNYVRGGFGRVRDLGNGHAVSESVGATPWGRPVARWIPPWGEAGKAECDAIQRRMAARLGEERAEIICKGDRNLLIFPNLVVNDIMAVTVRTFSPVAPDRFEVEAWALAPKDESAFMRDMRLRSFLEFLGPAGFATPDDVEMLELCQQGYAACSAVEWNDLSRGVLDEDGPAPAKQDELQMRAFWRRWHSLMTGAAR